MSRKSRPRHFGGRDHKFGSDYLRGLLQWGMGFLSQSDREGGRAVAAPIIVGGGWGGVLFTQGVWREGVAV